MLRPDVRGVRIGDLVDIGVLELVAGERGRENTVMRVRIDHPGRYPPLVRIDHHCSGGGLNCRSDADDLAVLEEHVRILESMTQAIEHGRVRDERVGARQRAICAWVRFQIERRGDPARGCSRLFAHRLPWAGRRGAGRCAACQPRSDDEDGTAFRDDPQDCTHARLTASSDSRNDLSVRRADRHHFCPADRNRARRLA